jgi:D-amino peptidase
MKIYISVDFEGICGTTHWDEVTRGKEEYPEFQKQMTAEVVAACQGAMKAGATEIVINDAHDSARNILARELPVSSRLIRGWSYHPYMMMQELDASFDAAMMIGYHSFAGGDGNPLSHTMSTKISQLTINGQQASEFLINWYTAMYEKVPVVFISGDQQLCDHAAALIPAISSAAVKSGMGASTNNIHPQAAVDKISEEACNALSKDMNSCLVDLPSRFNVSVSYSNNLDAYKCGFYPGARLTAPRQISFASDDYFDILRFFLFTL